MNLPISLPQTPRFKSDQLVTSHSNARPGKKKFQYGIKLYATTWTDKSRLRTYTSYVVTYRENGKRIKEKRASRAAAISLAETVETRIGNGQIGMLKLGQEDFAAYMRARQIIAPTGKSLELVCSEYANIVLQLGNVPPQEAIQFFLENRPRGYVPKPLVELIDEFLAQKKSEISKSWYNAIEIQLRRLARHYTGHLHALKAADINAWLRGLKDKKGNPVGSRTRHNYRAAIETLVNWATQNNQLPRTWKELDLVPDPGAEMQTAIKILTADQLTKLLCTRQQAEECGKAKKSLVPFIALSAFAGIRHEEMNGEKSLLDWRDIDLQRRHIYVPKDVAKTGRDRVVPICDNLAAWLALYAQRSGPICSLSQTSGALTKAKKAAGLPAGKNQTRNTLRKSFISYRLALIKNIAQVAEEAGNSPAKIRSNYNRPIPESESRRWFDIWPTAADVIQLNFAGM